MSEREGRTTALPTGTVTFLFTDIQGSTELLQRVGDKAYKDLLGQHHAVLRGAFEAHGGREVDTEGDAFFVAFPDAASGVAAAVDAQKALAGCRWPDGVQIRVRMGLHTGEPTLGPGGYVGIDVHRAARINSAGHGGQILLSKQTSALAESRLPEGITQKYLGEHRLKDLVRPEHIFQLVIPGLPDEFPPLKTLDAGTHNLPSLELTSFVGREREMEEIRRLLASSRFVTLTGPGGAGKTRVALQCAADVIERFPRGVWLAEFAPLSDPSLVTQTVAAVFNVREQPGRALLDTLVDFLKPRELLLVFDNCEHVVEASAKLAGALLRGCPNVRILATSREPLGAAGEITYRIPPLSSPEPRRIRAADDLMRFDATRLFVERAVLSSASFAATDANARAIAEVTNRLDGIPLAIELAAARVKVLSVDQIARRLDDCFRLLTGGSRGGLPHHQTLRATIEWSYDLLSDDERRLFRRLAVFAGGFTLEATEAVCGCVGVSQAEVIDPIDVLDLLARLVDKSLLVTEAADGDVRYRMLETIRQYSRDRLDEAGEADLMRRRHLDHYLTMAEGAEPDLRGPQQMGALARLEADHDNFRAALEWGRREASVAEEAVRLAGALHRFWHLHGFLREGREWLEAAAAREGASARVTAKAAYGAGLLAFHQGDYPRAEALSAQSLSVYREHGDEVGMALSLNVLGSIARSRSDPAQAVQYLAEAEGIGRRSGDRWALAETLWLLGFTARTQRDYPRAKALLEESLALWRHVGDDWGLAYALGSLGVIARLQGDYDRAQVLHEESLALRRKLGDRLTLATSLNSLGALLLDRAEYAQAIPLLEECVALCRELGNKVDTAAALGNLGLAAHYLGDEERAEALIQESLTLWRELGHRPSVAAAMSILGLVALGRGDSARAAGFYRQCLDISAAQGDVLTVANCLTGLARGAAFRGDCTVAARLFGAAEGMRERIGGSIAASDRAIYEEAVASVRARLSQEAFSAAWVEGRALSMGEAVAEALQCSDALCGVA